MSFTYFAGDGHFGQRPKSHFRKEFETHQEVEDAIEENWCSKITKRDTVFCMGDWALSRKGLERIGRLPGRKILLGGNHDELKARILLTVFDDVIGMRKYKNLCWLTHCPMHTQELFGKFNIHGHVHYKTINDINYVNVCMENIGYTPISFKDILEWRENGDPLLPLTQFNSLLAKA